MKKNQISMKKQGGLTLMEVLASLGIFLVVVLGALSLSNIGSSKSNALTLLKDINALRTATQGLYNGQGGYGTASLNQTMITASQVPTDLTVSGTTISTQGGGTVTITGNTTDFTIAVTNVPADVCTALLTNAASGWSSVKVGSSTAITAFPVSPAVATAAANCGGTPPFAITWTTTG